MKTALITLTFLVTLTAGAVADTFTVDNTIDPGSGSCDFGGCTLREAIDTANANPGADIIAFNIPGAGVKTITPLTPLPDITDPVTIDGYTQPGASENTLAVGDNAVLLIELDGISAVSSRGLNIMTNDSTIRGLIIHRFSRSGIVIFANNNLIEGNFIGTDSSGTVDFGNAFYGVALSGADGNVIGGAAPASRNLISGNNFSGFIIEAGQNNQVMGNYVGTDKNGTGDLGNSSDGIVVGFTSTGNVIGGTEPGAGNLVSGNGSDGVSLGGVVADVTDNTVQGNFIGTDATGTLALPNGANGVRIDLTPNNLIGGTQSGARNVISGNAADGILISDGASMNAVQGNFIGTDVTGTAALGNGGTGIVISDSPSNIIGGTVAGTGNLISANFIGVGINGAESTGNLIQGNGIGTDLSGNNPIGNGGIGVAFFGATGNTVGGSDLAGNVIAHNGAETLGTPAGILVEANASGNILFGNSIFANMGLGIDLVGGTEDANGVTANDVPDSDTGANQLQNYPVINSIGATGSDRAVEGVLMSNPNTDYTLDFYSNSEVDASGYGEGETYLGFLDVHTNVQGQVDFSFPLSTSALGHFITATATDPAGNTSEFSMASELVPPLSRFLNISTRLKVQTGDNVLIGGFIITGSDPKDVIVRAIGPSLGGAGVIGPLADPTLELHYPDGTTVVTNNDWRDTQETEIITTGIPPADDKESAIVATLDPGPYTAIVRGTNGGSGVGLVEAYDLAQAADSDLANISTRGLVETGDNVMIGGIIIGPDAAPDGSILIRALGPSLTAIGVPNALADPMLELRDGNGALIASNNDWKSTQQAAIEATGIPPNDDLEAAILATLISGNYTAIMSGVGGTTGIGLVEAYHLD
jgi:CSLREA domain-containing protein